MVDSAEPNKSAPELTYKLKYLRQGNGIAFAPAPDKTLRFIGLTIVHWGNFELKMNEAIDVFLRASGPPDDPNWAMKKLRRKELVRDFSRNIVGGPNTIREFFRTLAAQSGNLHWQRNVIVHGAIMCTLPPAPSWACSASPPAWTGSGANRA